MTLSEYLIEAVASRRTGKYGISPEDLKKGKKFRIKTHIDGEPITIGSIVCGFTIYPSMYRITGEIVTIDKICMDQDGSVTIMPKEAHFWFPIEMLEYA